MATLFQRVFFSRLPSRRTASTIGRLHSQEVFRTVLNDIKDAGTWKKERIITSRQNASITVQNRTVPVLNFCANNYLGLSSHPEVLAAAKAAIDSHGNGLSSVRFICGTQDIHKSLEQKIAQFHGTEVGSMRCCNSAVHGCHTGCIFMSLK